MDFIELLQLIYDEGYFAMLALNPMLQFGTDEQPMMLAEYFPEVLVEENAYTETDVRYRTKPAVDDTRYSPAVLNPGGTLVGSLKVELGSSSTADQMTGPQHDALVRILDTRGDVEAIAQAVGWVDTVLVRSHMQKNEVQRAQALCLNAVPRQGLNGYIETVNLVNIPNHRPEVAGGTVASPAGWHSPTYDLLPDILAGKNMLNSKGYRVTSMMCRGFVGSLIRNNTKMGERSGRIIQDASTGNLRSVSSATYEVINQMFVDEGLPPLTLYDGGYPGLTGFQQYLDCADDRDFFIMIGASGRMWDMANSYTARVPALMNQAYSAEGTESIALNNTLGYYAVGRNVGMRDPGRTIHVEPQLKKPRGYYGEAYQTGFPVPTEPEAIYVIQILRPTAS